MSLEVFSSRCRRCLCLDRGFWLNLRFSLDLGLSWDIGLGLSHRLNLRLSLNPVSYTHLVGAPVSGTSTRPSAFEGVANRMGQ